MINISSWTELDAIRSDLGGVYQLTRNLLTSDGDYATYGAAWTPIGTDASPFGGSFNGRGYYIQGLTIDLATTDYVGLFGKINACLVRNVGLVDADITGRDFVGGIVGSSAGYSWAHSFVSGSYVTGSISGRDKVGGLVGLGFDVLDCYSTASVTGSGRAIGGAIGEANGGAIMTNSYATGAVTGGEWIGGFVGHTNGGAGFLLKNCYSTGVVTGTSYVGGFTGLEAGTSINCGWFKSTTGATQPIGSTSDLIAYNVVVGGDTGYIDDAADWFYDKTRDIYDTVTPYWDFTTIPVWVENATDYPSLYGYVFPEVPNAPPSLWATAISGTYRIRLDWYAPTGGTVELLGYKIERESPIDGGWATLVANTGNLDLTYQDDVGGGGVQYNYRVSAINETGAGAPSPEADATPVVGSVPGVVTSLTALAIGETAIKLTWTKPVASDGWEVWGYNIERESPIGGGWELIAEEWEAEANNPVYLDSDGLSNDTQYNYRVTAVNDIGSGSACTPDDATTSSTAAWEITTWGELMMVNDYLDLNFKLMNDLVIPDPTEEYDPDDGWYAIGNNDDRFIGSFDGQGFEIHGITINQNQGGLFGVIGVGGSVSNIKLIDVSTQGDNDQVGGLAGANYGTITNCSVTGTLTGNSDVGGLVGYNDPSGVITECWTELSVTANYYNIGGLVGRNGGTITICHHSVGAIFGNEPTGGLVGYNEGGTIDRCYNTAEVGPAIYARGGGLVGTNEGDITNSYNTGNVGSGNYTGGLVAENLGTLVNCYNTGVVSGIVEDPAGGGGLAGYNESEIMNCWSVGSLIGYNDGGSFDNCGWINDGTADNAIGDDSVTPGGVIEFIEYNVKSGGGAGYIDDTVAWFYSGSRGIYLGDPVWDVATPVWYFNGTSEPKLENEGPGPTPRTTAPMPMFFRA